ncbi:excinuclease ABC subunit UvrC [Patescibacteria group bacterium]|nr:excinuclease ABC subunit UvrC [Patescibacteria group bacterium]
MEKESLKEIVKGLPRLPGVYIFKNKTGRVLYVGKAKDLRSRVGSYFSLSLDDSSKTFALVSKINDIEHIDVESEFEALILEAELIKRYRPKYNIVLKDDKSHIYIVIRNEKVILDGKKVSVSLVTTARKTQLLPKDVIFGPFPNGSVVKQVMRVIRRIFMFRDCSTTKFARYHKIENPCLFGHINVCLAPCVSYSEENLKEYKDNINKIKKLLSGGTSKLINSVKKEMEKASKEKDYEKAAKFRDLLQNFYYLQTDFRSPESYIDNPYLLEDLSKKALVEIKKALPIVGCIPQRIECYDISNVSGKEATGSMVVATEGKINKEEYKRFKVKFKSKPDDFAMMYEVLYRRFKRKKDGWKVSDLVVLDGGKPQVSAALEAMKDLDIYVPVVGLAKKEEILIFKDGDVFREVKLSKDNEGLRLLIQLRDEAHRFAQRYHHLLRKKALGV